MEVSENSDASNCPGSSEPRLASEHQPPAKPPPHGLPADPPARSYSTSVPVSSAVCFSTRHPSLHRGNISSSRLHRHHRQFLQCSDEHRNPPSPAACLAVFPACQRAAAMWTVRWTQRLPPGLLRLFACPLGPSSRVLLPLWKVTLQGELRTLPQAQAGCWLGHCSSVPGDRAVPPCPDQSAAR